VNNAKTTKETMNMRRKEEKKNEKTWLQKKRCTVGERGEKKRGKKKEINIAATSNKKGPAKGRGKGREGMGHFTHLGAAKADIKKRKKINYGGELKNQFTGVLLPP